MFVLKVFRGGDNSKDVKEAKILANIYKPIN